MPSGIKKTHEEFMTEFHDSGSDKNVIILGKYTRKKDPILCQCKKCNYIWRGMPNNLLKGSKCPACLHQVLHKGYNDLATVSPELAAEWDTENNGGISPSDTIAGGKTKSAWKCAKGHKWQATIYDRLHKKTVCPYCCGSRAIRGETDMITLHPELKKEWNYKRNGDLSPYDFTESSGQKVWWICEKGHEWKAVISSRTRGIGCPHCANELQTSFPEQTILFYLDKSGETTKGQYKIGKYPIDIFLPDKKVAIEYDGEYWHRNKIAKDNKKNLFLSERGIKTIRVRGYGLKETKDATNILMQAKENNYDELKRVIQVIFSLLQISISNDFIDIQRDYHEILKCQLTFEKSNSLESVDPDILRFWNYKRNTPIEPSMVRVGSRKKMWWLCPTCKYEFQRSVDGMVRIRSCPVCVGKTGCVKPGFNDLEKKAPHIAKEWDNEKNEMGPNNISYNNSTYRAFWICPQGHSYQARVCERVRHNTGCPYCLNKKTLQGYNDLESQNPELLKYWDYEKNNRLPSETYCQSKGDHFWICQNGHSFVNSPYRLIQGEGCPYCKHRKIERNYNSLAVANPKLSKEWHPTMNGDVTPFDVMPNATKKYWWLGKCGHVWDATVANRNNRHSGCPYCNGKKAIKGVNDFASQYPEIAKEWHPEKNGDLRPDEIRKHSSRKIWWKCKQCGHEWQATPDKRSSGSGCPCCSRKKIKLAG